MAGGVGWQDENCAKYLQRLRESRYLSLQMWAYALNWKVENEAVEFMQNLTLLIAEIGR